MDNKTLQDQAKETKLQELALLKQQHVAWRNSPQTKGLLKVLDSKIESVIEQLGKYAYSSSVTDAEIRLQVSNLSTLRTIKTLIYDTETFVAKCSSSSDN